MPQEHVRKHQKCNCHLSGFAVPCICKELALITHSFCMSAFQEEFFFSSNRDSFLIP